MLQTEGRRQKIVSLLTTMLIEGAIINLSMEESFPQKMSSIFHLIIQRNDFGLFVNILPVEDGR